MPFKKGLKYAEQHRKESFVCSLVFPEIELIQLISVCSIRIVVMGVCSIRISFAKCLKVSIQFYLVNF